MYGETRPLACKWPLQKTMRICGLMKEEEEEEAEELYICASVDCKTYITSAYALTVTVIEGRKFVEGRKRGSIGQEARCSLGMIHEAHSLVQYGYDS